MGVFTAEQIITRAAAAADMHDNFITQAQWLAWFAVESKALDLFLVRSGLPSKTPTVLYNTDTAFKNTILYDGDPLVILGVWEKRGDQYRRIPYRALPDFPNPAIANGEASPTGDALCWSLMDLTNATPNLSVHLYPTPATNNSYFVLLQATQLGDDTVDLTSAVSYPAGIEEVLVLKMARRALLKEDSDTGSIDKQLREAVAHAEEYASSLNVAGMHAVRNVDRVERAWASDLDPWSPYIRSQWVWV